MSITTTTEFENYLVQNGDVASESVINRAPIQLKSEINEIYESISSLVSDTGNTTLSGLGVTATAAEINTLSGFTGTSLDFKILAEYSNKLEYLQNVESDIQTQINNILTDGGTLNLSTLGVTATADQLNWLGTLATSFNIQYLDSTELSYLNGATSNIQTQLNNLTSAISNISTGGATIYTDDIADLTVNATQLNWVASLYDQRITSDELAQLNGCSVNIQNKFNELENTISSLGGSSSGVTSVNGQTGNVTLTATSIGAASSTHTQSFSTITSGTSSLSSGNIHLGTSKTFTAAGETFRGIISGESTNSNYSGVLGSSSSGYGVGGTSQYSAGVAGYSSNNNGVIGASGSSNGGAFSTNSTSSSSAAIIFGHGSGVYGSIGTSQYALSSPYPIYISNNAYPFTGAHLALSQDTPDIGDIMVAEECVVADISNSTIFASVSEYNKDKNVIGVYNGLAQSIDEFFSDGAYVNHNKIDENSSTFKGYETVLKDEFVSQKQELDSLNYMAYGINALGEGAINVCSENGDIQRGDYIVSSSQRGKGMKQDDDILRSSTVAKALQSIVWSSETVGQNGCYEINGFKWKAVACSYHCG